MKDNSIQINNYLQNEMSADEKAAFEMKLAADKELQQELQIQQRVIAAAEKAGLKQEFAKAIRQRRMIRRTLMAATVVIICLFTVLVVTYQDQLSADKNNTAKKEQEYSTQENEPAHPFINPPLAAVNVPVSEYTITAETGGTIFHPSGSVIYFPPNAMVNEAGALIKGTVHITYREFADPLDFFVSGIPMQFDSAGKKYNFESSGMCEINARQENKTVFVNPLASPQLHLSSKNKSPLHNVYYLDTVARSWKYTGKDTITEVRKLFTAKPPVAGYTAKEMANKIPERPLKPVKASDDRQHFNIKIDPGSFEELFAYDNMRFEVLNESSNQSALSESSYKPSDAEEHWDNVKLDRSNTEGVYSITFTNALRKVTYKVRPVLEGADYTAALKVFNEKNRQYEEALKNRIVNDQRIIDSITVLNKQQLDKMNAAKARNEKMNALIAARNKQLKEQRAEMVRRSEELRKAEEERFLLFERNQEKYIANIALTGEILRTFTISNFGVWNCDHPQYPVNEIPLFVKYTDSSNNSLPLFSVSVVYKGFNGITQFPSAGQIRVIPGSENMIWSIADESFYYFSYADFMQSGITKDSKDFVFRLRKAGKKITSYKEIRQLAGNF